MRPLANRAQHLGARVGIDRGRRRRAAADAMRRHLHLAGRRGGIGHERFGPVEPQHEELVERHAVAKQHRKARHDVGQARGLGDEPGHGCENGRGIRVGHDRRDGQYNPRWMPSQRVLASGVSWFDSAVSGAPESHRQRRRHGRRRHGDRGSGADGEPRDARGLARHAGAVAGVGDAPPAHAHPPRPRRRHRNDPSASSRHPRRRARARRAPSGRSVETARERRRGCMATPWSGCGARWRRCPSGT